MCLFSISSDQQGDAAVIFVHEFNSELQLDSEYSRQELKQDKR